MCEEGEFNPFEEVDWTVPPDPKDWTETQHRRLVRDQTIMDMLQRGKVVQYVSGGWSLWPRVHPYDCVLIEPVTAASAHELVKDDIVFCKIQETGFYFTHKILDIETVRRPNKPPFDVFTIGNYDGSKINGHCKAEKVYGRLIEVIGWTDPTAASAPSAWQEPTAASAHSTEQAPTDEWQFA